MLSILTINEKQKKKRKKIKYMRVCAILALNNWSRDSFVIIIITGSVRRTQQTHTPRNAVCGDDPFTHSLALKGVNHSTTLVFSQAAAASSVSQSISNQQKHEKIKKIKKKTRKISKIIQAGES